MVRSGLRDLKEEIKKLDEDEKETDKPNEIAKLVKMILQFNNQNQEGKGLRIVTLDQILSRLPISLSLLKAGNNSKKTWKWNKTILVFFVSLKKINQNNL